MKFLVLVLSLVAAGHARPDVSHLSSGYNYNPPSGSSSNIGISSSVPSGSYLPGSGSGNFGNLGSTGAFPGSFGSGGYYDGAGGLQNPQIQEQKHVYFYSAPDEEEQARLRIQVAPSSQKNTKIIFVKTPSYGAVKPEIIAPPSQTEDKTLVYVLVKKQEQGGAITIPASHISKPTKPEVYFIKYKTKQEAEQAVNEGLQEQSVGSNLPDLGNEQSFVRTIKDEAPSGFGGNIGSGDLGGDISSGSSLLGTTSGGSSGSGISGKYGPPGASGPY